MLKLLSLFLKIIWNDNSVTVVVYGQGIMNYTGKETFAIIAEARVDARVVSYHK